MLIQLKSHNIAVAMNGSFLAGPELPVVDQKPSV
jgi:hypothetical protein